MHIQTNTPKGGPVFISEYISRKVQMHLRIILSELRWPSAYKPVIMLIFLQLYTYCVPDNLKIVI